MTTLASRSCMEPCLKQTAERADDYPAQQDGIKAAKVAVALTVAQPILREIEVKTEWGPLLDASHPLPASRQFDEHEIWLIDNLFSPDECSILLEKSELHGYGTTNYPKAYRGNLRLITTDTSLSEAVWRRLEPLVPPTLSCGGVIWDAVGLNECWRLAKYHPGDRFQGHCDASFSRSRREQSMFTVNISMNEGFKGGSTRFYLTDLSNRNPDVAIVPQTGLCLLFRQPPGQQYYHDGDQLQSGLKYLFRSDVMYRRRS
eukprot:TRINITY_DN76579_c0_g1_i1.p1 TRINITY_DN76579_c0_g1~~TRINITY_DN76579_c0_g1_i1.p1  ORF type:complete len:259 (-),score=31.44 TRINITY_DN76579_c0_g1_i1:245-1021(-)